MREETGLSEAVAELRALNRAQDHRMLTAERSIRDLGEDLDVKHRENRKSIHDVRNGQQRIIDKVHALDVKFARASGYAAAAGALVAVIVKLIDHLWK